MDNQEQKIKLLEEKVKILEETLDTLKNMQMSEQMEEYIKSKAQTLKMTALINSLSDKPELDLSREQNAINQIQSKKKQIDKQIANSIQNVGIFSNTSITDTNSFEYEIETGSYLEKQWDGEKVKKIRALAHVVNKGIRITSYIGFDSDTVVIPKMINDLPVTSIGKRAFINSTVSKVILPDTVIAILEEAFNGCRKLCHIDLPNSVKIIQDSAFNSCTILTDINLPTKLSTIGGFCFANCGLKQILLPDSLKEIPSYCFYNCNNLSFINLGNKVTTVKNNAFDGTKIIKLVFPQSVKNVSYCVFGEAYLGKNTVECAFLSKDTTVVPEQSKYLSDRLKNVNTIYCLPGSAIHKYCCPTRKPQKNDTQTAKNQPFFAFCVSKSLSFKKNRYVG